MTLIQDCYDAERFDERTIVFLEHQLRIVYLDRTSLTINYYYFEIFTFLIKYFVQDYVLNLESFKMTQHTPIDLIR